MKGISLGKSLLLLTVFAVLPFLLFLGWAIVNGSAIAGVFAILFAPVALVTLALDIRQIFLKRLKTKDRRGKS